MAHGTWHMSCATYATSHVPRAASHVPPVRATYDASSCPRGAGSAFLLLIMKTAAKVMSAPQSWGGVSTSPCTHTQG